jgi:hypothetical protein
MFRSFVSFGDWCNRMKVDLFPDKIIIISIVSSFYNLIINCYPVCLVNKSFLTIYVYDINHIIVNSNC